MSKNSILPHSDPNPSRDDDIKWMSIALELAQQAEKVGEVPIGAVLVRDQHLIGQGYNQSISIIDPTAHAEIQALRQGAKAIHNYRLTGTTLYVTLEPCAMCAGAIIHARVQRLVYGADDPKSGAAGGVMNILQNPVLNHQVEIIGGILAEQCSAILKNFFKNKR